MAATRKSRAGRSRKSADTMAKYKKAMDRDGSNSRESTPRKSPTRNASKTRSDASTRCSAERGNYNSESDSRKELSHHDVNKTLPNIEIRPGRLESATVIPETPPRQRQVAGRKRPGRLESATVLPETPPRQAQVVGRLRSAAPQPLRIRSDGGVEDDADSQMPSKKRKTFSSPPHGQSGHSSGTRSLIGEEGGRERNDPDPTVFPQTCQPMDMDDLDLFEPPLAFSGTTRNGKKDCQEDHVEWSLRNQRDRNRRATGISRPFLSNEKELEILSTSSEALSRFFDSFRKKMVEEIRGLNRQQLSDLREMNETTRTSLMSEVGDIRGVVEMLSTRAKGSSSGKSGSKTSLNAWEKKLNGLTPNADIVFSKDVLSRVICFNAPLKAVEVCNGGSESETDAERASIAVQTLIFSLQPEEKKFTFSEGVGKLHSEFKYGVVQNALFNVIKDTFDMFKPPMASDHPEVGIRCSAVQHEDGKAVRIGRPPWLERGYLTVDHIKTARKFVESLNQSRKSTIRGPPSSDDIASHGVDVLVVVPSLVYTDPHAGDSQGWKHSIC